MSLELKGVTVAVPDGDGVRVLLEAVDLAVAPGEVLALTGPSGSGKSTLLAVAGLLRRPDAGEVLLAGEPTGALRNRARTKLRGRTVGVVYQSANLFPSLTAVEQLEVVAHVQGRLDASARRRARDLLDELGIGDRAGQLPAHLSGGERQRVGLARALMAEPRILLADEPTASLDPRLADEVAALLAGQAHARDLATLVVTHDEAPLRHADRRLDLDGGALTSVPAGSAAG